MGYGKPFLAAWSLRSWVCHHGLDIHQHIRKMNMHAYTALLINYAIYTAWFVLIQIPGILLGLFLSELLRKRQRGNLGGR